MSEQRKGRFMAGFSHVEKMYQDDGQLPHLKPERLKSLTRLGLFFAQVNCLDIAAELRYHEASFRETLSRASLYLRTCNLKPQLSALASQRTRTMSNAINLFYSELFKLASLRAGINEELYLTAEEIHYALGLGAPNLRKYGSCMLGGEYVWSLSWAAQVFVWVVPGGFETREAVIYGLNPQASQFARIVATPREAFMR